MIVIWPIWWFAAAGEAAWGAETLNQLLARIDQSAAGFRAMTAKLERTSFTAVIKDTSVEQGAIAIKMSNSRDLQLRIDFTTPDEKSWAFRGRKAELFIPKINTVQEYDLGKHSKLVDQFLLLGFGTRTQELKRNYTMQLVGEDVIGGRIASKLELIPKSQEALQHLKKVEIWFPLDSGFPVQQKFHLGSGDYVVVSYGDVKLHTSLPDSAVRLNLPKNVKREYPQK